LLQIRAREWLRASSIDDAHVNGVGTFVRMQNNRQLSVWRKAHAIALNVRALTDRIPTDGNRGVIDQLRRASLSIPANIVEGSSRRTDKDFVKFLNIALGSTSEVEYHLQYAAGSGIITPREFELRRQELVVIRMMLSGLIKYLREPKL